MRVRAHRPRDKWYEQPHHTSCCEREVDVVDIGERVFEVLLPTEWGLLVLPSLLV